MGWQENLARAMRDVDRAVRDAGKAARDAGKAARNGDGITQNVVVSGGGNGYSLVQYTSNGRRISIGPGYVVVEHTYWLTSSPKVTVAANGGVWQDGVELFTGRPVPGYRPGAGGLVKLDGGRLWLNGHPVTDYVAPPGTGHMSVEQDSRGGNQNITFG